MTAAYILSNQPILDNMKSVVATLGEWMQDDDLDQVSDEEQNEEEVSQRFTSIV